MELSPLFPHMLPVLSCPVLSFGPWHILCCVSPLRAPRAVAPEIIQLNPPQFTSDIWAVGCTIVELLTGSPPYFNLIPMQALFRIVQDQYPPLPEDISDELRQFLRDCFTKDPSERPSAQQLLNHRWFREVFRSSARDMESEDNHARDMAEVKHHQQAWNLVAPPPRASLPRSFFSWFLVLLLPPLFPSPHTAA